jgi:hypothetical protein
MNISFVRLAGCLATAALIAGCSANSQGISGASPTLQAGNQSGRHIASPLANGMPIVASSHARGASWMQPDLGGQALIYVANFQAGSVSVFAYNDGKSPTLVGTLTGFDVPVAACSDNKGNVFIGDFGTATITEFAHGATLPTQVLQDPQAEPQGCAVDPTTGNLAAINWACTCGTGNIAIYANATGTPKIYTNAAQSFPESAAYDPQGNLVIAGRQNNVTNVFEVAKGTTKFTELTVKNGTIDYPGQVEWGGSYLLIGEQQYQGQNASAVYQTVLKGKTLTIHGTIPLTGTTDVFGFAKRGSGSTASIAAADVVSNDGFVYSFPGGQQTSTFSGMTAPLGMAISQAVSK